MISPVETTLQDTEKQIHQLCWKAYRKWGGSYDDYVSAANVAWANAYDKWDASKGTKFNTYLHRAVWNALLDENDARTKHNMNNKQLSESVDYESGNSRFENLIHDISDDARLIVQLVLESPEELACVLNAKKPEASRNQVWVYLKRKFGWSMARTLNAFSELKEVA